MLNENDVCILYVANLPESFIRIESIVPDNKKGWFQVTFLKLQIPTQEITWLLDESQVNGNEFTINNYPVKISYIPSTKKEIELPKPKSEGNVIDFLEWKARLRKTEVKIIEPNIA